MSKYEIIKRVKEDLKDLDIATVISKHIPLKRERGSITAICPFHDDERVGNFFIDAKSNRYKCFACGESGDSVDFIKGFYGINFTEAVTMLGQDFGLISISEYDEFFKENEKHYKRREPKFKPIPRKEMNDLEETRSIEILDLVYGLMLDMLPLSKKHLNHLLKERKLSDYAISSFRFKSLESKLNRSIIVESLIEKLSSLGYEKELLIGVPGFYKKNGTIEMDDVVGLVWPVKNAYGQIEAIQVRKDVKLKHMTRYVWFTSSFATNIEMGQSGGSTPSQPLDVVYPKTKKIKKILMITEGKFKAITLAEHYELITISVQGVTNWAGISEKIKDIESIIGFEFTTILTAFDADLSFKFQVFEQLQKMTNNIVENFPNKKVIYLHWDHNLGKGIDDLIISGNLRDKNVIKKLNKAKTDEKYGIELELAAKNNNGSKLHIIKSYAISNTF